MSRHNDMTLTMDSDTFAAFRADFDTLLARTIGNMEMKGADEATITCKFGISLEKQQTRDYLANGYDGVRDIINPTIKHDITSVMQVKDKTSGKFHGDYELVYDRDQHRYVVRKINNGQIDMFDEDGNEVEVVGLPAPEGYESVEDGEAPDDANVEKEDACQEQDVPAAPTPFDWLCSFIGTDMIVTENAGIYTVRTTDNRVIVSSAASEDSPLYCPAEKMQNHVGCENIVCVGYGEADGHEYANVSIECEDCGEVIFDMDVPKIDSAKPETAVSNNDTDDDIDNYEYESPESAEEE